MSLLQHPLSAAFPAMSPEDLSTLCDDIAANGLRQPVVTFEGQVLDGWHRYQACQHAEVEVRFVELPAHEDPIAFVISSNAHRRHLSASQRAAAVTMASAWKPSSRPVVAAKGEAASPPRSNAEMAKLAGTTERTIQHAKRAVEAGLGEAVRDGKVSAEKGAAIAKLPPKERKKAVANPEEWQEKLAKKPSVKDEERLEEAAELASQATDEAERMADIAADYEALLRINDADDKLAEARLIIKEQRAKYEQLEKLYESQRRELAEMTREAKRWMKKAQALEKGRAA